MCKKLAVICSVVAALIVAAGGTVQASWSETFDGSEPDLTTWQFHCFPDMTKTFTHTIKDEPGGNKYISLDEISSIDVGGSAIGMGFGSDEAFSDVRVGAVLNVIGDVSRTYHGLAARISHFVDPDGSLTGVAPGVVTSGYLLMVHYEEGPANLKIELMKVVLNDENIMETYEPEVPVPGLDHARSRYIELDVVGSDPVYITSSIYEYKGGPLLVRTPTFIDTSANDPWEREGIHDDVFASGVSSIFVSNQELGVVSYHTTFDSVSSVSDGPAAVNPSPADGAAGVPIDVSLSWVEAEFATSRELWLGKAGAMEKVDPAPTGTTYTGALEFGQTYQWRVDQIGPSGTVTGYTWSFTTEECTSVEDFESYADDAGIRAAWFDNIAGFDYVYLATDDEGNKSMRFEFQNQYEPYSTEAISTYNSPQDWTAQGVEALSLSFIGEHENMEHLMYLKLEDAVGKSFKVEHPYTHACQSDLWREWTVALGQFSDAGVDLGSVRKIAIGFGNGTTSGQEGEDKDAVYIDQIRLWPARCFNVQQLDLRGDVNGDCRVDIDDFVIMIENWLNDGLSAVP